MPIAFSDPLVDFVHQQHVGEDRSGTKYKFAFVRVVHMIP